eukprot:scaffold737_cov254-Pinguiococcus_pyrenoidosus.AAC.2
MVDDLEDSVPASNPKRQLPFAELLLVMRPKKRDPSVAFRLGAQSCLLKAVLDQRLAYMMKLVRKMYKRSA